jgi:hypothetical protein
LVPGVLHPIEQFILEGEVAPAAFVEDPTEGRWIKVDRDRGKLLVTNVGTTDRSRGPIKRIVAPGGGRSGGESLTTIHCGRRYVVKAVVRRERQRAAAQPTISYLLDLSVLLFNFFPESFSSLFISNF